MIAEEPVDPPMHDLKSKGLKKGSVSLIGAVSIGLAATAPAYSLTGALGHGAAEAGYQLPVVFIIAVVPMFFVALAYKHLTDAAPDAGTVFTWGSKANPPAHRLDRRLRAAAVQRAGRGGRGGHHRQRGDGVPRRGERLELAADVSRPSLVPA
jgi:hypothetical protein